MGNGQQHDSVVEATQKDITEEQYDSFYMENFYDYEKPLKVIHTSAEGVVDYKALLFVPSHAPYNYYNKSYEKGLKLYTNGVLITDKCADLIPDCYSFVKGLVDSELTSTFPVKRYSKTDNLN